MLVALRSLRSILLYISLTLACAVAPALAQTLTPYAYDIGSPVVTDYYVNPSSGSDDANGTSPSTAWRTVQHAWNQIPESTTLSTGVRINLMNGNYGDDELPNYWELREGTASAPIILRAASGQTQVKFMRDINMANVSYFYLVGIEITPTGGGDTFHCEGCDHILLRGNTLNGGSTSGGAHETVKINQSQHVYIENNNISNADDNNIDFVAVQYGHIIGNRIHDAADWCLYVKGGSAYIRIESNTVFNCGTGGITAGQGSGFQFMTSPWIHYEAYDVKVINNVIHDVVGAALGVNGGYNILLAHNTAYRIGSRSHMLEIVYGERTCDGIDDGDADSGCLSRYNSGGWGPRVVNTTPQPIGNLNVSVLNNIFYNPSGFTSPQHIAVYGPRSATGTNNIPSTQYTDTNLKIQGNIIWNGSGGTPLGVEDNSQGCQDSNPTCTVALLQSQNSINAIEPGLEAPSSDDFRPSASSNVLTVTPASLASFNGGDRVSPPLAPAGELSNSFTRDLSGALASGARVVGAYDSSTSALTPPAIEDADAPSDPDPVVTAPTVTSVAVQVRRSSSSATVSISARVTSSETPSTVRARIARGTRALKTISLSRSSNRYTGSVRIRGGQIRRGNRVVVRVTATNSGGSGNRTKNVTVR